jgi:hypothetical protein
MYDKHILEISEKKFVDNLFLPTIQQLHTMIELTREVQKIQSSLNTEQICKLKVVLAKGKLFCLQVASFLGVVEDLEDYLKLLTACIRILPQISFIPKSELFSPEQLRVMEYDLECLFTCVTIL